LTDVNLAGVCQRLGLWEHRQHNPAAPIYNTKAYATLLEAIAGAILLDAGGDLEVVKRFMRHIQLVL
jgi:dsRNA-specific ribonuclease